MKYYIIDLPYAYFAIGTEEGIVTTTPPIARWMVGKTIKQIKLWVESKNGITRES
jgi:hypothetical protein